MKNNLLLVVILFMQFQVSAQVLTPYLGTGHVDPIASIQFTPDGNHLLTMDEKGKCVIWNFLGRKELSAFDAGINNEMTVINDTVVRFKRENSFYSIPHFRRLGVDVPATNPMKSRYSVKLNGSKLVLHDGEIPRITIPKMIKDFKGAAISSDGQRLAHVSGDEYLILRKTRKPDKFTQMHLYEPVNQVAFHPHMPDIAALGTEKGNLIIVDTRTERQIYSLSSDILKPIRIYSDAEEKNLIIDTKFYSNLFDYRNIKSFSYNTPLVGNRYLENYRHEYLDSAKRSNIVTGHRFKLRYEDEDRVKRVRNFIYTRIKKMYIGAPLWVLAKLSLQITSLEIVYKFREVVAYWKEAKPFEARLEPGNFVTNSSGLYYSVDNTIRSTKPKFSTIHPPGNGRVIYAVDRQNILAFRSPFYVTMYDSRKNKLSHFILENVSALHTLSADLFAAQVENNLIVLQMEKELKRKSELSGLYLNASASHREFYVNQKEQIVVYDTEDLKEKISLKPQSERKVTFVLPITDQKRDKKFILFYDIGMAQVLSTDSKLLATLYFYNNGEFVTFLPDGKFYASTKSLLQSVILKDARGDFFQLDQFEAQYNRPDVVLETIGMANTELVEVYRMAYNKFVAKSAAGPRKTMSLLKPPVAIVRNNDVQTVTTSTTPVRFSFTAVDTIENFNVFVNNVPLGGKYGFTLKGRGLTSLDTTMVIQLNRGENIIKPVCVDNGGVKSFANMYNITADYKHEETIYFLGIGIDYYSDKSNNLKYAVKDIKDLATVFGEKYKKKIVIDTIFNSNVTKQKVMEKVRKLGSVNVNDKVIIAYSGHGLLKDSLSYFLSTAAVNFSAPQENGLSYDSLEVALDLIPARQKIMFIDACNSGAVDKDSSGSNAPIALKSDVKVADDQSATKKGISFVNQKKPKPGVVFDVMQDTFYGYSQGAGTVIISAARGNQYALEGNKWNNGAFTYSIKQALFKDNADLNKNGTVTVSELKIYVGRKVVEITGGTQNPTARKDILDFDWSL